jgi:hypothetical protein
MDQLARDDIAAATAAHRELGRDYDSVAEGLIERIGAEIAKRVDARLAATTGKTPAPRGDGGQLSPASRSAWPTTVLALGSMAIGTTGDRRGPQCREPRWAGLCDDNGRPWAGPARPHDLGHHRNH